MASAGAGKRALPSKVEKMRARKKQKLSEPDATKPTKVASQKKQDTGDFVDLDSLNWQEVQAPENLENYEGFFGLEEIEGVDVVRAEDGGRIAYKLVGEKAHPTTQAGGKVNGSGEGKAKIKDVGKTAKVKESRKRKREGEIVSGEVEDVEDRTANGEAQGGDEVEDMSEAESWGGFGETDSVVPHDEVDGDDDGDGFESIDGVSDDEDENFEEEEQRNGRANASQTSSGFELLNEYDEDDDAADVSAWRQLRLSEQVLEGISRLKFAAPTQIQAAAIPKINAGSDLIGKAPTGSGKTLAFGIPIIEEWLQQKRGPKKQQTKPVALIIEPTRELAQQVNDHLRSLCSTEELGNFSICTLTGGLSIQKQRRLLKRADVVVATPGRLWEVVSEGHGVLESFKRMHYLVIDEADRLLNEGHFKELSSFLDALTRKNTTGLKEAEPFEDLTSNRQTLVFSATFSKDLQHKLARRSFTPSSSVTNATNQDSMSYLLTKLPFNPTTRPTFIDVSPTRSMAQNLREGLLECPGPEKDLYTYALLLHHPPGTRALIFVNSISAVQRLVPFLQYLEIDALPLHSYMEQKQRLRTIERFSGKTGAGSSKSTSKRTTVLLATDIAARGLDIPAIDLILHYHVPRTADVYIHRSGRTARASASGTSILLCAPNEAAGVRRLLSRVHNKGGKKSKNAKEASADADADAQSVDGGLKSLTINGRLIARLKPRATLSKTIADASLSKVKKNSSDNWLKNAADDLGVDLDDPSVLASLDPSSKKGKGSGRRKREDAAASLSKAEVGRMKAELREMLSHRVNAGVSERYIAGGGVDVGKLLREGSDGREGKFLGRVEDLGF